jgi:hypothetical protein
MSMPKMNYVQSAVCPVYPTYEDLSSELEVGGNMEIQKPTCFKTLKVTCKAATPATPAEETPATTTPATTTEAFFGGSSNNFYWLILLLIAYYYRKDLMKLINQFVNKLR